MRLLTLPAASKKKKGKLAVRDGKDLFSQYFASRWAH